MKPSRTRKMYYNKEPHGSKIAHENKAGKQRFKIPGYERELCSLTYMRRTCRLVNVQTVYTAHEESRGCSEFCSRADSHLKDKTETVT